MLKKCCKPVSFVFITIMFVVMSTCGTATRADNEHDLSIRFNESMIKGLALSLPVSDPVAMSKIVFSHLDESVYVYPTENYYYFSFESNGQTFSGNFRLSPDTREQGKIHFAYFNTSDPQWFRYVLLGREHGVTVDKLEKLQYRITYEGKEVEFQLNEISQQRPPKQALRESERFIGRSMDESGLTFELLYDEHWRGFLWTLTDTSYTEQMLPVNENMQIDIRTAFIFYHDLPRQRWILAGVSQNNIVKNNYFDGPFDQLPDNHLEDTAFSEYVDVAYPNTKGQLNKRGEALDGHSRLAVTPYIQYSTIADVVQLSNRCQLASASDTNSLFSCLFRDLKQLM